MRIILKNISTSRRQYTIGGVPTFEPDFRAWVTMVVPRDALNKMIGDNGEWLTYLSQQLSYYTPGQFIIKSATFENNNGEETYNLECVQHGVEYPPIDVVSHYLADIFTYKVEFGDNCVIFTIIE